MNHLLEVKDLVKHFPSKERMFTSDGYVTRAVDGISFNMNRGETLALVGESGCGKSTTARMILQLLEPTSGQIIFEGEDLSKVSAKRLRQLRRDMQIIFQDPFASLNPRLAIGNAIEEPLVVHNIGTKAERRDRVEELLRTVGLNPEHINRYPHEFSGGQKQRINIARALATNPKLLICDEPVAALDLSIRAQILNLLSDLQEEFGLTYLLISHDLSTVWQVANRVIVMYLGKLAEIACCDDAYLHPHHPYSQALLSAVPIPDPVSEATRRRIILQGDVPSPANPPSGCRFHTRCPIVQPICKKEEPPLEKVGPDHSVACFFASPNPITLNPRTEELRQELAEKPKAQLVGE